MKQRNKSVSFIVATIFLCSAISCSNKTKKKSRNYTAKINQWHHERIASLKEKDSWLSLAGLFKLEEGMQSIGSDSTNDIVFPPKAPAQMGTISKQDSTFILSVNEDANVLHDSASISKMRVSANNIGEATFRSGDFLWYIIERRSDYYIRLKDTSHPNFTTFNGIKRFPVSQKWRVKATFKPLADPKVITVPDVLNEGYQDTLYGKLEFTMNDKKYSLAPFGHPQKDDEFFIIFGDNTNGETTYGGGRYIYIPTPNENGITYIDFNKAYNPPCVFTDFATCPLPPPQNRLDLKVTAGEKMYGEFHH